MLPIVSLKQSVYFLLRVGRTSAVNSRFFSTNSPNLRKRGSINDLTTQDRLLQLSTSIRQPSDAKLIAEIHKFNTNQSIRQQARSLGIKDKLFKEISTNFLQRVLAKEIPHCSLNELPLGYQSKEGPDHMNRVLFQAFIDYAEPFLPKETVNKIRSLRKLSDLRFPSEWFPAARGMQRKINLHVGPTNSGKTYQALKRLEVAKSGLYCGPLRLLAHEIFARMNEKGITCNLLTGEEKREISPDARLTSSTVEMASLGKLLDVAVIDEIQMIADRDRGWAWTQAFLGLKAKQIHLCGEEAAVPLIEKLCRDLGEEVVVNRYERLTPYSVSDKTLRADLSKVEKGDCVIAFSRGGIFDVKRTIEAVTDLKCAVIYGGLPPETRALQAKAFNDPDSGFDVLVASDAIGMGLNLNIKRIIFRDLLKFDGKELRYISFPQVKQIAGRAGRFGTIHDNGIVTTLYSRDLDYIKEAIASPIVPLEMAGLQPTVDILELFALQMPEESFSGLLEKFEDLASKIADMLEEVPLKLRDRYQFVTAPVNTKSEVSMKTIKLLAQKFNQKKAYSLNELVKLPYQCPFNESGLEELEETHKQIILYMWLSTRYPDTFITVQDKAIEIKIRCERLIDEGLKLLRDPSSFNRKRIFSVSK
ncbi:hypothetical protein G6F61_000422 [Rhizopus arrhizus]|nr:hypothetical protein G6F61_000422 [Rhizopus arrhizus]